MTSSLAVISRDWSYPIREARSSLENPQTPLSYPAEWLLDMFNGGRTDSGIRVSELTAFQVSTFLACVDLIAGKISSLPFHVYERQVSKSGRAIHRIAYEHDYYDLIHIEPNEEMSRQTFLKAFLCHGLAWTAAYAEIQRDASNQMAGLWPLNPAKTRPRRLTVPVRLEPEPWRPFPVNLPAGKMVFETTDGVDSPRMVPMEDMLHVPGLSFDGRVGQSVVWLARQTIGLALATEKFGAKYFANYARPGGILKTPLNIGDPAREAAKRSWQEAQGGENSNRIAVLPNGFEWQAMSNNPEEAQTVQLRGYNRNEICAIFHVSPHMAGDIDKGRSNTEQLAQEFLDYALAPWMNAIKLEWKRKLFPHSGIGRTPRNRFYVDFETTEMLRPDAASREKFYASGRQWGYLNANDVRAFEKLNPIEEGEAEEYWMPVNMTLVGTPIDPTHQDGSGQGVPPVVGDRMHLRMFRDAFGRLMSREKRDAVTFSKIFGPILYSLRDAFQVEGKRNLGIGSAVICSNESEKFIRDYFAGMEQRALHWDAGTTDETVIAEFDRAFRAIRVATFRELATAKAKESV